MYPVLAGRFFTTSATREAPKLALCAVLCLVTQLCLILCDCSLPGSSAHGDSPSKKTGVGCHALLQGIFPTQGSNPGLPHCSRILYQLSHEGSPWVQHQIRSDQTSRSVVSDSLQPHEPQHARPPCPSPTPGVHSDSRPSSQ